MGVYAIEECVCTFFVWLEEKTKQETPSVERLQLFDGHICAAISCFQFVTLAEWMLTPA